MTKHTRWVTVLSVAGVLMAGGLAQAQEPGAEPGAGGAQGAGAITNQSTTTTTTTETTAPAIDSTALVIDDTAGATAVETIPNTGGAPLLMSLSGALLAGGALLLRRKLGSPANG